jgi:hypothetical protein
MSLQDSEEVARQAEQLYHERLQATLEKSHRDEFVAIEPQSGDYFLGRTLSEAVRAARQAHPERLSFVLRIGHRTAVHIGVVQT